MKNIVKQWKFKGRQAVITFDGHYCAYFETKLKGVDYSKESGDYTTSPSSNIEAHGGITYAGNLASVGLSEKIWFFGMDFAHSGDHQESPNYGCSSCKFGKCHKWTLKEVETETKKMALSILAYEKKALKFEKLHQAYLKKLSSV